MVRIVIVTNPVARRTRPHLSRWVADSLSDVAKVTVVATTHRNHATDIAAQAAADGDDAVVALGGDGTVNEVLQGIAQTPTRLAVLPGGSTNVYARILGLPRRLMGATAVLRDAIAADRTRRVPAGRANDRWFAWCAGFGYDAEVVGQVERHPRMKRYLGQPAFLLHGWGARSRMRDTSIRIQAGPPGSGDSSQQPPTDTRVGGAAVICNADPYTFLGPLASRMCPEAVLDRGLDCTALNDLSWATLTGVVSKALTGSDVQTLDQVTAWRDREWYELSSAQPLAMHTDGDPIGASQRLRVQAVPDAINLLV